MLRACKRLPPGLALTSALKCCLRIHLLAAIRCYSNELCYTSENRPCCTGLLPSNLLQCNIQNMRDRIARLAGACDELAKHGRAKPEPERGLDEASLNAGDGCCAHALQLLPFDTLMLARPCVRPLLVRLLQISEKTGKSVVKSEFYSADPLGVRCVTFRRSLLALHWQLAVRDGCWRHAPFVSG